MQPLITADEAAAYLRMPVAQFLAGVEKGALPAAVSVRRYRDWTVPLWQHMDLAGHRLPLPPPNPNHFNQWNYPGMEFHPAPAAVDAGHGERAG